MKSMVDAVLCDDALFAFFSRIAKFALFWYLREPGTSYVKSTQATHVLGWMAAARRAHDHDDATANTVARESGSW